MIIRRFLKGALALTLASLLLSSTALANHHVYLGTDSGKQLGFAGHDNRVAYWWALTNASAWWWAEADLQDEAVTATANWNSATGLPFYNSSEAAADFTVRADTSIPGFGVHSVVQVFNDTGRDGAYVLRSSIKLNTNLNPQGGLAATLAHEIGHYIGLHERYRDDGGSGSFCHSESTIMNSGSCANRPAGPSALDANRVNGLYNTGDLLNMNGTGSSGYFTLTWKDGAWGEREHTLYFYRWNGSQWIQLGSVAHTAGTGVREVSWRTRTLSRSFSRSSYGAAPGWFIACGWTKHKSTNGNWACSNYAWVS